MGLRGNGGLSGDGIVLPKMKRLRGNGLLDVQFLSVIRGHLSHIRER